MNLLIANIIMSIFSIFNFNQSEPNKSSEEIYRNHTEYVYKKYGAKISSYGRGYPKKIEQFMVGVDIQGPLNVKKSRKMILDLSNDLLKRINKSKEIRPYLHEYPFDIKNIRYSINAVNTKGGLRNFTQYQNESNDDLAIISLYNGKINYNSYDGSKGPLNNIHKESYDEALKKASEPN